MAHELAGKPVQEQDIIDLEALIEAYSDNTPDMNDPTQLVSFGTSGHRGTSLNGTFTDLHVAAITQAICDGRGQFGATGPIFVGQDTHALSQPALVTVLEVLAGNGIVAMVYSDMDLYRRRLFPVLLFVIMKAMMIRLTELSSRRLIILRITAVLNIIPLTAGRRIHW